MEKTYTDLQGFKHDLTITQGVYRGQPYYRIFRDGNFYIDITRRENFGWEELFNGPSDHATEYGNFLDTQLDRFD